MHSTRHYGTDRGSETPVDTEFTVADADPGPLDDRAPLGRGEALGRYVVLETLGQGGMGIVLAAYDSTLDRRVALKLLRRHASSDPENHARLLREAQALAKLSHPRVVSVYDVGELRGQVFIAMEYIDGPNLRQWRRSAERTPAQVIEVFRAAAKGLRAAHEAGIVHRDFKPDNVLIGSDGGVRVTDFGLALEAHVAAEPSSSGRDGGAQFSGRLTETGMVMGTPAYMPIEQHAGLVTDHRSDQFSFCVSLFEALYGVRPFSGNTANEYCAAIRKAEVPAPPSNLSVPRRVHRAMIKGLAAKPEDRHASMQALIRALSPRTTHGRTWVLGGVGGLALGAAAVALLDPSSPCSSFDERIEEVWSKTHKRQLLASFTATGLPFAQDVHDRATARLDDYAERWTSAARDACLASERGEQSDHMLDLRMHCLDRARSRLRATVDVLSDADATIMRKAVGLASSQAELGLCADLDVLGRTAVLPADAAEAEDARALLEALHRIEALRGAGRKEEAKMLFAEIEERIEVSAYPPVQAAGLWARGRLLGTDNEADAALEAFEKAHLTAIEHGLDHIAANAASSVGFYLAEFKSNFALSEAYLEVALSLAKASGSTRAQSAVYGNIAMLRSRQARFDEAVEASELALEAARATEDPSAINIAETMMAHAQVVRMRDGPKAGQPLTVAALEYTLENLGRNHPSLVQIYESLSTIARELGDNEQAYIHVTAALDQARTLFGDDSLDVTYQKANLATVVGNLGRREEALTILAEVDAGFERELGHDHPVRAAVLNNIASLQIELERWDEAEASWLEALRIAKAKSEGHSDTVAVLSRNIALHLILQDRAPEARPYAQQGLEHTLAVYGPENMNTAAAYSILGRVAQLEGHYEVARTHHERAVKIGHDSETTRADFEFELGRTLVEDPASTESDRARGMRLARRAENTMATAENAEATHRDIVQWLADHQEGFSPG
ncbi:MAG: protein kinase domain-containing protein [Nannocystaceae bacterium]|nr:tetratricopeptide repeat protein [bacterium]